MRPFKLGVIVDSFRMGFSRGVEMAAALGAEGVQMYMVSGELAWDAMTPEKIRAMRACVADNGVEVSAVCGDLGGHGFEIKDDNPRKIEISKRIMDAAGELGTRVITTHIGVIPSDPAHERYKIMQEACGELGLYADKHGMKFAIETGPEPADVLKGFLDCLGCGGMAVNYDPANFVMVTGQDPVQGVHILKDYIVHTHAKDGRMFKQTDPKRIYDVFAGSVEEGLRMSEYFIETPLGEGQVPFPAYLAALRDIGYAGYLTVEREVGDMPAEDIKLALNVLRDAMNGMHDNLGGKPC